MRLWHSRARLNPDLAARLGFIYELDRLKSVLRQNVIADGSRNENSAEHSWHLAMTALAMAPYAKEPIDLDPGDENVTGARYCRD